MTKSLFNLIIGFTLFSVHQAEAAKLKQVMLEPDMLEIINIRVGQGDSTLILGPQDDNGKRISVLFDGADMPQRDGGNILRTVLYRWGVKELDFFILSHDDADHLGGVAFGGRHGESFILGFDDAPGSVGDDDNDGEADWLGSTKYYNPDPEELGTGDDLVIKHFVDHGDELLRTKPKAIRKYKGFANSMGERITINNQSHVNEFEIDLGGGAKMICYASNGFVRGKTEQVLNVNTPNERSMSFLVKYKDFDYLISGDLIGQESGAEDARVEEVVGQALVDDEIDVDVLHVNHHGGDNASSAEFLEIIQPTIAVISAGNNNSHGHPRLSVLKRLVDAGVDRIIQTSWGATKENVPPEVRDHQSIYQSDVIIRSDGDAYKISTDRVFKTDY